LRSKRLAMDIIVTSIGKTSNPPGLLPTARHVLRLN
jgi:hypothetical protein